jgi:hypothetical protein
LPDFGYCFVLLPVERFGRLGFGKGLFDKSFGPLALVPSGPRRRQAGFGAFADNAALKFSQGSE